MWMAGAAAETAARPDTVWSLWADVAHWPSCDPSIVSSTLKGPCAAGVHGVLTLQRGPRADFTVTSLEPGVAFVSQTRLPFARLDVRRALMPIAAGTRIVHRIEISGPLAALFGRLLGPEMRRTLPNAVANLARRAGEAPAR